MNDFENHWGEQPFTPEPEPAPVEKPKPARKRRAGGRRKASVSKAVAERVLERRAELKSAPDDLRRIMASMLGCGESVDELVVASFAGSVDDKLSASLREIREADATTGALMVFEDAKKMKELHALSIMLGAEDRKLSSSPIQSAQEVANAIAGLSDSAIDMLERIQHLVG